MKRLAHLVALSVVLVGCNGNAPPKEGTSADSDFVSQMASKTQGDPSKLTPEERAKLDEITKGRTDEVIRWHPAARMPPAPAKN
jgi:hypothetical protein